MSLTITITDEQLATLATAVAEQLGGTGAGASKAADKRTKPHKVPSESQAGPLLDQRGLAKALQVSDFSIRQWVSAGIVIPAIREGKVLRFDLKEVRRHLAERA